MIPDLVLGLVCIAQTATIAVVLRSQSAERRRLLNGVIAKSPQEFAMMEKIAAKPRPQAPKPAPVIPYGL